MCFVRAAKWNLRLSDYATCFSILEIYDCKAIKDFVSLLKKI